MTVYCFSAGNMDRATNASAFHIVTGKKVLKEGSGAVMTNSCLRQASRSLLGKENSVEWEADPLRIRNMSLFDEEAVFLPRVIKISKDTNIYTVISRHEVTYAYKMQSLLSSAQALHENYTVRPVNLRILDIVPDMRLSNVFADSSRVKFRRCLSVGKMMIQRKGEPTLPVNVAEHRASGKYFEHNVP